MPVFCNDSGNIFCLCEFTLHEAGICQNIIISIIIATTIIITTINIIIIITVMNISRSLSR